MTRGPLTLAALASAAVPGLDPVTVEGVVGSPTDLYDVAFVHDTDERRWVVRAPRTAAASAHLAQSAALLSLLARRMTMTVPAVKGWAALEEGGRAAVHAHIPGRLVDVAALAPGAPLTAGLGRALAQVHNLDLAVYEEAGVPVYTAAEYRSRRLADLDRAAATGRVPTGLLSRWERVLDDVGRWRFAPTPTHGGVDGARILATSDDEPQFKALIEWEGAQVADPADDLAPLVGLLEPAALDTLLEAYAHARVDRPDAHLLERARLGHEMHLVRAMMACVAAGDDDGAEEHAARLRRLDADLAAEEDAPASATASTSATAPASAHLGHRVAGESAPLDSAGDDDVSERSGDAAARDVAAPRGGGEAPHDDDRVARHDDDRVARHDDDRVARHDDDHESPDDHAASSSDDHEVSDDGGAPDHGGAPGASPDATAPIRVAPRSPR